MYQCLRILPYHSLFYCTKAWYTERNLVLPHVRVVVTRSPSEREVVGSNHGRVWQAELATGMAYFSVKWHGSPDMAIVARKGT